MLHMRAVMTEEKRRRSPIFKTLQRAVLLVWHSGNVWQLLLTSIWIIIGAFLSFTAVFNRNFLNAAASMVTGAENAYSTAVFWLFCWAGMEIIVSIINIFSSRAVALMWTNVAIYVEQVVVDKITKVRISYFDDREQQRKIGCVKGEFSQKVSDVTDGAFQMIRSFVSFLTVCIIIIGEKPVIALILTAAALPAVWVGHKQTEEQYYASLDSSFESAMQNYLSWLLIRRKYIKEMRFYNLYDYVNQQFDESVNKSQSIYNRLTVKYSLAKLLTAVLQYGALILSLILITIDILQGKCGIGSFVLIYSSAQNFQGALSSLFSNFDKIGSEGRYLEDYEEVMQFEEEQINNAGEECKDSLDISFEHVHFTYPGSDREILKDINLTIHQGEKIAIIGENGSGKSTFVMLLSGLYSPVQGTILVNGRPMEEQLGLLRRSMSCTMQDFGHYDFTIAENVRIGDLGKAHDEQEVMAALKKAGLSETIEDLPRGIDTPLGNHAQGSIDLSGGQWQKLAMARNLLKSDAKLMLMDEPTAALDPVAESKLYQEFQSLTGDKTVLLISHRLGATRLADRILVFSDGQIVEDGSHEALLKKNGLYAEMYQAQSQWYV
ncbi:MAG: ABC transporter ATP-binding protein [Lachnospiraceae bacterium]|nr:ABC transporter ATP-binding protein [Lachnospiraceae bacterium]